MTITANELARVEIEDYEIIVVQDPNPQDPRKFSEPLGKMVCWHYRYRLGDDHDYRMPQEFKDAIQPLLRRRQIVMLPLYLLDHSGLALSTQPFNDPWDSGQVGWIYASHDEIRKAFGVQRVTKHIRNLAVSRLVAEVEEYNSYLQGDCYGYEINKLERCTSFQLVSREQVSSCYGFFGDCRENGILEAIAFDLPEPLQGEAREKLLAAL